jgi:hypothetical protein
MLSKGLNKYIFAIDISLILYLIISSLLIIFQYNSIPEAGNNIIARVLMLVISLQIIYLQKNYATPFMEFIHILLPYFYLIYFYYEAPALNFFNMGDWAQSASENADIYFLGNTTYGIFSSFMDNKIISQLSYLVQLLAYASVPALVFIAYAKSSVIGKKFAFISYSTILISIVLMQIFPSNINEYESTYTGIIGEIYELFQIIIYGTTVSTLNILVGFLIVSALFFITIDKRITIILSTLWILTSFAGILLNQQYFSGTILTWILAPLFFMLANYAYKQLEKVGIS